MRLLERAAQSLDRDVGIALGGRQIRVAQKLLNGPQIRTALEHVGCSAVAHGVWGNRRYTCRIRSPPDHGTDHARVDARAPLAHE